MPIELCADLERTIFDIVVADMPRMAPWLVLVAHRVRTWVNPVLYGSVNLQDRKAAVAFVGALEGSPELAGHVKHLRLGPQIGYRQAYAILSACHPQNLWLETADPRLHDALHQQVPTRLTYSPSALRFDCEDSTPRFAHAAFANITHLQLTDHWRLWTAWACAGVFADLPHATHLALVYDETALRDHENRVYDAVASILRAPRPPSSSSSSSSSSPSSPPAPAASLSVLLLMHKSYVGETYTLAKAFEALDDDRIVVIKHPEQAQMGGGRVKAGFEWDELEGNVWMKAEEMINWKRSCNSAGASTAWVGPGV